MPWVPEVFSAPALAKVLDSRGEELVAVPYFDGLMAGESDALAKSFAGVPEVHVPLRGRVKGTRAFEAYMDETSAWLRKHNASVEDVEHVITDGHGFEEVVLHLDGDGGRVELPVAVVAAFEPDGLAREPAGARHINGGDDGLRRFYERLFSNGGGIALESCAVIDDARACALEYNVASWGETELAPEAGFAVYVRGPGRRLAAARTYDDADFRPHPRM